MKDNKLLKKERSEKLMLTVCSTKATIARLNIRKPSQGVHCPHIMKYFHLTLGGTIQYTLLPSTRSYKQNSPAIPWFIPF